MVKSNFSEDVGFKKMKVFLTDWNKEWVPEFWIDFFAQDSQIQGECEENMWAIAPELFFSILFIFICSFYTFQLFILLGWQGIYFRLTNSFHQN